MRKQKKLFISTFIFCTVLFFNISHGGEIIDLTNLHQTGVESSTPLNVLDAAQEGIGKFIPLIPKKDIEHYGFVETDDLSSLKLGTPYRVLTINPEYFLALEHPDLLKSLEMTNIYFFPVILNDEYKCLLTIDLMDNKWEAVSLGAHVLATELESMEKLWSNTDNNSRFFIRIFQATSDVMAVKIDNEFEISLFTSAIINMNLKNNFDTPQAYSSNDISSVLLDVIPNSINISEN